LNKQNQLAEIHHSGEPYIIYKSKKGFNLFTNFSKKIVLNNNNIKKFLEKKYKNKRKKTDLHIGFFGYEILNNLINIKIPKQKDINFPKGIFYKPEKIINLSNNLKYKTKSKINPLDFFTRLSKTNLAPEAFMIKDNNYSIISCSPENLITKNGSVISTKPIAGTVKKTKSLNKIKALDYFKKNIKETKEHNMIVDMERNDLSRVCKVGSVKLSKQKIVEEYKDLFHYVSLIKGKLKKGVKNIDIIKAMMPGGSVIGCPKINTLNLLNKQEKENRNIYTGSFGYIKFNGDMRFNIIIRSILNFKNFSEISVASGVVVDSNSSHEFNENFIKAKALIDLFK